MMANPVVVGRRAAKTVTLRAKGGSDDLPERIDGALAQRSSRMPGFYKLTSAQRRDVVARWAGLDGASATRLRDGGLGEADADTMVENAIGVFALPLGVATNFIVNGTDVLVPMAVEEPSVIAAASYGALLARRGGGFTASSDEPIMIGQLQILDLPDDDLQRAANAVETRRDELLSLAHAQSNTLPRMGGGAKGLELRPFPTSPVGPMLVLHLLYDTRDAMGANAVNTACEAIAPLVEEITGGRVLLRILSNLASERLARASCAVPAAALRRDGWDGAIVARRIVEANALAVVDPWRAATHNKGVLNGIDPVVIATGNDWRGAEAGAHAWAARDGSYRSLTNWTVDADGTLHGELELPLALGIVGGGTRAHPTAGIALQILDVSSARQMSEVIVSVGLAQNLSALRALVCEGIQPGHMALHARQLAMSVGARGETATRVAQRMVAEGIIRAERAREILADECDSS